MTRAYPDISDILARKVEGRRKLAQRSFGEKIDWLERFREEMQPFREGRERRRAARAQADFAKDDRR
jgi:hypothetical protein